MRLAWPVMSLPMLAGWVLSSGVAVAQFVPLPPVSDSLPQTVVGPEAVARPFNDYGILPPQMEVSAGSDGAFPETFPSTPSDDESDVLPAESFTVPAWHSVDYWFGPVPWDTSIELGLNGSEGTTDVFSVRAGGNLDRQSDWNKVDVDLVYNRTSNAGVETQNNAQLDMRHDWLFSASPWTVFAAVGLFYDEYQAFDLRFNTNGGLGYRIVDNERSTLIGRFGAGTSREFGGPDNRWVPEALFGMELDYTLNERQKIAGKVDYFPDWGDFSSYRVVTDLGWEVLISEPSNVSLKLAVIDRYDSTPNGAEPHLLNYSVLMLWKL